MGAGIALASGAREFTLGTLVLVGAALGSTAGYSLFDTDLFPDEATAPRAGPGVSVMPMLGTTQAGGLMGGLGGRS